MFWGDYAENIFQLLCELVALLLCLYIPSIFVAMIPVFLIIGFALSSRILLSLIADTLKEDDEDETDDEEES